MGAYWYVLSEKKKRNFATKVYPTKVLGGLEKRKYVGNWMSRTGAFGKSRKENPQKPTQLSSRSHPRHLVGKRTAQKTPS